MLRILLGTLVLAATFSVVADAGTLYAVKESGDQLVSIDTDTLAYTVIGPLNTVFDFGGLGYDTADSIVYMIGGRPNEALYTVDVGTGKASKVGVDHGIDDLFGLTYDSSTGSLYAAQFVTNGGLYTLSQSDGSPTFVATIAHRIGGLAYDSKRDHLIGVEDGAGDLWEIDRKTGEMTLLYAGDYTNDSGLTYDWDKDVLWDIDWNGNLYMYDIQNGFARTTVLSGLGAHDGLAYVPEPGTVSLFTLGALLIVGRRR